MGELCHLNMKYEHLDILICMKNGHLGRKHLSQDGDTMMHIIIKRSGVSSVEEEQNSIPLVIIIWDGNCLKW